MQGAGRIEIKDSYGMWGGICDDSWGILDGHVICRMLGYPSAESVVTNLLGGAHFTLDDVECTGKEYDIFDCPRTGVGAGGVGSHNCGTTEWAGVQCQEMDRLRLKGPLHNGYEGYVYIKGSSGNWGGICDDSWDKQDADVICKMLGYLEAEEAYLGSEHSYGPSSGNNFILDNVECTGFEFDIFDCPRIGTGAGGEEIHNCGDSEWAAVKCSLGN